MSVTDDILNNNNGYRDRFEDGALPRLPSRHLAVVACMDARLMVADLFGIAIGEANIIRNAGGIVNDETLRSLIVSTQLLGTREIVIVNHTDCGMLNFQEHELLRKLREQTGAPVDPMPFYSFTNLEQNVAWQVEKVKTCRLLPKGISVRGFIYDVKTGKASEVSG